MQRLAYTYLTEWLELEDRKPLVIRGARQVGKTWLVRHFAKSMGKKLIEVNLEKYPKLVSVFEPNEPTLILERLRAAFETEIKPSNCLLFIDEIQEAPELFPKLRWFAEDLPELPVIAAGSLLEFVLGTQEWSMPVGRISYLYLEPLSFEEFLLAHERQALIRQIKEFSWKAGVSEFTHDELMSLFKEYLIVGGMPEAVANWVKKRSLSDVSRIHNDIMHTYRDDFGKYSRRIPPARLNEILTAVPLHLAKKFVYSKVNSEIRIPVIKDALQLLTQARLCHRIKATAANGIPLAAEANESYLKVIMLDVGLISSDLGLSLSELESVKELDLVNKGGIAEQVTGQLLRTIEPEFLEPALYYWVSTNKSSTAEIDYIIQHGRQVIPIEVKAGTEGKLKSLHYFMYHKKFDMAVRVNSAIPTISQMNVKDTQGNAVHYQLRSIPFYLISELHRLLD